MINNKAQIKFNYYLFLYNNQRSNKNIVSKHLNWPIG